MSGQRSFTYLNRRPAPPETWQDIACKTLDVVITVPLTVALLCGVALAVLCALT